MKQRYALITSALIALFFASLYVMPVRAQSGYDFEIVDGGGSSLSEGQWYEVSPDGNISFYFDVDANGVDGSCITVEFEYSFYGSGNMFQGFAALAGITIDANQFNSTNQAIDADGDYTCTGSHCVGSGDILLLADSQDTDTRSFVSVFRESGGGEGDGSALVCVDSSSASYPASVVLKIDDPNYFSGDADNYMRARFWYGEPSEPVNYCPDGTEALTETVTIEYPYFNAWTTSVTTTHDAAQVRYVITGTDSYLSYGLLGEASVNGATEEFNSQLVSPSIPITLTVPVSYGVSGPVLNLEVANFGGSMQQDEIELLSACVIPYTGTLAVPFCSGYEALSAPVTLSRFENHSEQQNTGYSEFAVTFWLYDAVEPEANITVNGTQYLIASQASGVVDISLPISPTINGGFIGTGWGAMPDGNYIEYDVENTGADDFLLASVCVTETEVTASPINCNLYNHDFITSTTGWDDFWDSTLSWVDAAETNGAAELTTGSLFGQMFQELTDYDLALFGPYNVEARVRSDSAATNTVSIQASQIAFGEVGYYEVYSQAVGTDWTTLSFDFYMDYPTNFAVNSYDDTLIVDWVCISDAAPGTDWFRNLPVCTFPSFDDHPQFSITSLLYASEGDNWFWWLAIKLGQLFDWLACMIERVVLLGINLILELLAGILDIDLPRLDSIRLDSLMVWLGKVAFSVAYWLGESLWNMIASFLNGTEWLRSVLLTIAEWLWQDVALELITWLFDQAVEAGLIGEDAAQRILWMLRNIDIWAAAVGDEIAYEFESLMLLMGETVDVFGVLLAGMQSGLMGTDELDMGESLGGLAGYLWRGVEYINEIVAATPLSALNLVALGIIFLGLGTWSIRKFEHIIEFIGTLAE